MRRIDEDIWLKSKGKFRHEGLNKVKAIFEGVNLQHDQKPTTHLRTHLVVIAHLRKEHLPEKITSTLILVKEWLNAWNIGYTDILHWNEHHTNLLVLMIADHQSISRNKAETLRDWKEKNRICSLRVTLKGSEPYQGSFLHIGQSYGKVHSNKKPSLHMCSSGSSSRGKLRVNEDISLSKTNWTGRPTSSMLFGCVSLPYSKAPVEQNLTKIVGQSNLTSYSIWLKTQFR